MTKPSARVGHPPVTWPETDTPRRKRSSVRTWLATGSLVQILSVICAVLGLVVIFLAGVTGISLFRLSDASTRIDHQQVQIDRMQVQISQLERALEAR